MQSVSSPCIRQGSYDLQGCHYHCPISALRAGIRGLWRISSKPLAYDSIWLSDKLSGFDAEFGWEKLKSTAQQLVRG